MCQCMSPHVQDTQHQGIQQLLALMLYMMQSRSSHLHCTLVTMFFCTVWHTTLAHILPEQLVTAVKLLRTRLHTHVR